MCHFFRDNTERPITVDIGTNHLAGTKIEDLIKTYKKIINGGRKTVKFQRNGMVKLLIEF